MDQRIKFVGCALGIFTCYFYYGVLQERITRGSYGSERFTYTLSLVWTQCVINCIFARLLMSTVMPQGEDKTRKFYYAASSLTYLLAMVCSNMALQWVNYPTQVIGKSCKPIPVMVLGVLLGRKQYSLQKYFFVLLIVIGVALFIYKEGGGKSLDGVGNAFEITGELLLLMSLTMDGCTGAVQERMRGEYKTKSMHMMYSMNLYGIGYLSISNCVGYSPFLNHVSPWTGLFKILMSHLPCLVSGETNLTTLQWHYLFQLFIFVSVADFGPLPCSIITTTRKFFTVLGSVVIFGNRLIPRQWLGTCLVFS
ncbi:unnamed protein product, partial [Darwinula stevensoni]